MKSILLLHSALFLLIGKLLPGISAPIHVDVYANSREFAAWPANEGLWAWGNEILSAAWVSEYLEDGAIHNHAPDKPKRIQFSRSFDGGLTWEQELHDNIPPPGSSLSPLPFSGNIDFMNPNLAMRWRDNCFFVSANRGHTWEGPYRIPLAPGCTHVAARTSYIPLDSDRCLVFTNYGYTSKNGTYERAAVLKTSDGGRSWQFLSWIGPDIGAAFSEEALKKGNVYTTMPQGLWIGPEHFVASLRLRATNENRSYNKKWGEFYESTDGGKSWQKISEIEQNSVNPISLVYLGGKNIAAVYGDRGAVPIGIYAKISRDLGRSWSNAVALRSDAREWDIGYAISTRRPDGKILTLYYFTTEKHRPNFVAATIWDPEETFKSIR